MQEGEAADEELPRRIQKERFVSNGPNDTTIQRMEDVVVCSQNAYIELIPSSKKRALSEGRRKIATKIKEENTTRET